MQKIKILFLFILFSLLKLSIASDSVGSHAILIAPGVVISAAVPGFVQKSVEVRGHTYGVKHYKDHPVLGIRLLFLDYPVLTASPIRIYYSAPQRLAHQYLAVSTGNNKMSSRIDFKGVRFGVTQMIPMTVSLGDYYSFFVQKNLNSSEVNSIKKLGSVFNNNQLRLGAGLFAFDQKSIKNLHGLIGICGYIKRDDSGLEGDKHFVYFDRRVSSWINSQIAQALFDVSVFKKVPGYVPTQLPIAVASSTSRPVQPISPKSVPVYHPGGSRFNPKAIDTYVRDVARVLEKKAFILGVDFSNAEKRIRTFRSLYISAKTETKFHDSMYEVLRKTFGNYSHLYTFEGTGRGGKASPSPIPPQRLITRSGNHKFEVKYEKVGEKLVPRLVIPTFDTGVYNRQVMDGLIREAMKSGRLIIDLRGNPGGDFENVRHLLKYFIKSGTVLGFDIDKPLYLAYGAGQKITSSDYRSLVARINKNEHDPWQSNKVPAYNIKYSGRLYVLVDQGSGSGAEISAEALVSHRKAILVGEKTMGGVLFAHFGSISGGMRLCYPISDYITSSYYRIEGQGLSPTYQTSSHGALSKALELANK